MRSPLSSTQHANRPPTTDLAQPLLFRLLDFVTCSAENRVERLRRTKLNRLSGAPRSVPSRRSACRSPETHTSEPQDPHPLAAVRVRGSRLVQLFPCCRWQTLPCDAFPDADHTIAERSQ